VSRPQRPRTAPTGTVGQQQAPDGPQSVCSASQGPPGVQDGLLVALPWPPTVNTYYRHVVVHGHPRVLISAAGRQYAQAVGVLLAGLRDRAPAPPHAVSIALHAPNRARIDLDNRCKGLLDAMYRALDMDDSVIDRLTLERAPVVAGGRALVLIETLPAEEA
jgi:crossover junction endodeoxyribonuclease RusA